MHVQATQEPPKGYAPVAETLVLDADGVTARYWDHHLDGIEDALEARTIGTTG